MASMVLQESMIGMGEAARLFPAGRKGQPVDPRTVWRWCRCGVSDRRGGTLRLESIRISGRYVTSREAVLRFIEAQNEDQPDDPGATSYPSDAAERAGRELELAGV